MNILLIYSTYSGSTGEAVQLASTELTNAGHTVTIKSPLETTPEDCTTTDCILLASPSWDYEGKVGQPHEDFMPLLKSLENTQLTGKPYAVLGLGDSAYQEFCGAVDVLETFMNGRGAVKKIDSLRIDKYFSSHDSPEKVTAWAKQLA